MTTGHTRPRPFTTVAGVCFCTLVVGACELGEVVVPPSEPIVIVQAIMRPDRVQQWILIEESLSGATSGYVQSAPTAGVRVLPQGSLATPVEGATVTVSNVSRPADPCGVLVPFAEALAPETISAGMYWAPPGCPTIRPGDTLELRVEAGGNTTTGHTVIPLTREFVLRSQGGSAAIPGPAIEFNRDVDTLTAEVAASSGRGLYFAVSPRPVSPGRTQIATTQDTWFWVDSTQLQLPGDFVNVFEADFEPDEDVPDLFAAGQNYVITLARPDTNYFDYLRSGNSPLSGRGFINHLAGGFGLFGSMVVGTNELRAVGTIDDARERTYRFSGVLEGTPVDLSLELYVGRPLLNDPDDRERFAAFATGTWVHGTLDQSLSGLLSGNDLRGSLEQETGSTDEDGLRETRQWTLSGMLAPDGATLTVVGDDGQIGTLVQIPPSG